MKCDSLNCENEAYTKIDTLDLCYKCYVEYKELTKNNEWYDE